MLREGMFRLVRAIGGALPLSMLEAILLPFAVGRSLVESAVRRRRPPSSLPPVGRTAPLRVELRERTAAWMSTASLLWADRFSRSPWRERIDVADLVRLRAIVAQRPVVLVTIHFGGIFVLPTLLRAHGIPTAAVVGDKLWPVRWWRQRRADLTQIDGLPAHVRSGDARQIIRYLVAGRCLLAALDYPFGGQTATDFEGASIHLSTPVFRLARIARAVVVPAIVSVDGLWRYRLNVGEAVPDELVASGDDAAVLRHVVGQLLPIAAARPEQAMPLLVNAFQTGAR